MIIKPRFETVELQIFRCLVNRMDLSSKEMNYFYKLKKGFEGEQKFDTWSEQLPKDWLILTDLLYESSNTIFQIDSLMIARDTIYLFEVKNFDGDFYVEGDKWYTISKVEVNNPLLQVERADTLFRKLFKNSGCTFTIESYLVFINHEFQLFQAPINLSIIFHSQLNRFLKKVDKKALKNNTKQLKAAEYLLSSHLKDSPYSRLPNYKYDQLKKGITCVSCNNFITMVQKEILICHHCGFIENAELAVLRGLREYTLLFPDRKVTTAAIHEWCSIVPKKNIWKILSQHLEHVHHGRSSYFVK